MFFQKASNGFTSPMLGGFSHVAGYSASGESFGVSVYGLSNTVPLSQFGIIQ